MNHVKKQEEITHVNKLMLAGHHTDVRTLCISSDNTAILSGSAETVKIWNRYNVGGVMVFNATFKNISVISWWSII